MFKSVDTFICSANQRGEKTESKKWKIVKITKKEDFQEQKSTMRDFFTVVEKRRTSRCDKSLTSYMKTQKIFLRKQFAVFCIKGEWEVGET